MVVLTLLTSALFFKYRYVRSIILKANGTHIDLICWPPTVSSFNMAIADIHVMSKEELMQKLSEGDMQMGKADILPIKIDTKLFGVEITGEAIDKSVVKAVFNGQAIDTSMSIDPVTGQLMILDIKSED